MASARGAGTLTRSPHTASLLRRQEREFNTPPLLAFVDLRKAYDSVNRDVLWIILRERYHLPDKLVKVICAIHHGTSGAARAYGRVSKEFSITTGARQGDVLAPALFFDAVVTASMARHTKHGIKMLYNLDDVLVGSQR